MTKENENVTQEESGVFAFAGGRIDGVSTIGGGSYQELLVNGVCTIRGDADIGKFSVNGVCTNEGDVAAERLDCDGVLTIKGKARVKKADVKGVMRVGGDRLEADHIVCDGALKVRGEISADRIEADGAIHAREIVGDRIYIKSYWKKGIARLFCGIAERVAGFNYSEIELIEATSVELRAVLAKSVSGRDIVIGRHCEIERVDCSGTLRIDPTAKVGEITGEHARI